MDKSEIVLTVNQLLDKCEISSVLVYLIDKSNRLYKVRPGKVSDMGKPPKGKSGHGRFNPFGISYFYCSENIETCIFEALKEPKIDDIFTIGEFSPIGNQKIMGFYATKSVQENMPFLPRILDYEYKLLEDIIIDLSKVYKNSDPIYYIPTQYIFEYINNFKHVKIDGLAYHSKFGTGMNYVFKYENVLSLERIFYAKIEDCDIENKIIKYRLIN